MKKHIIDGIEVRTSSDNVFCDLDVPDAQAFKIKTGLMVEIMRAMRRLGLRQVEAAKRMGITQPKLSALLRGDFRSISERKLMNCLNRLGYDIEIQARLTQQSVGQITFALA